MTPSETSCSPTAAASTSAPIARRVYGFIANPSLLLWIKISIAVACLLVLTNRIDRGELLETLWKTDPFFLSLAIILLVPNILIQWLKWHYLLTRVKPDCVRSVSFKSLMVGFPLGIITPGRFGEIGRGFLIKSIPKQTTLVLAVVDKTTNMLTGIVFGTFAIALSPITLPFINRWQSIAVSFLIMGGLGWLAIRLILSKAIARLKAFSRKDYLTAINYSIIFYFTFVTQLVLLVMSFEAVQVTAGAAAAAGAFWTKTLLPISIGDLGIREGAVVFFFSKIGVTPAAAFNAAILLFLINVVTPTLLGTIFLLEKSSHQVEV